MGIRVQAQYNLTCTSQIITETMYPFRLRSQLGATLCLSVTLIKVCGCDVTKCGKVQGI